ncbi:MAG: Fic family protein [Acidobacteria bacterium]|nr:Fic family protein [Acidobacteriota bacterium]
MTKPSRYDVSGLIEAQYQPGSRGRVLRNILGITRKREMDVHTELVLIHPFREGNGRLSRMLAILMAAQAGLPPLDFSHVKGRTKQKYFWAVQAGMDYDYAPMEEIFTGVIERTLKLRSRP